MTAHTGHEPRQPHRRVPAARPQARHDQQAVVVRRADLRLAVERDQRVAPRDHVAAAIGLHEGEAAGGRRHRHGDLGETLLLRIPLRQRRMRRRHIEMTQQPGDAGEHRVHRRLLPVLTGLHQARGARRRRIGEPGIVDDAAPARVSMIGHHQRRHAGAECKPLPLRRRAAQDQRIRRPQHRVQVEQHIHRVDQRPDLARAVELGGAPRAVQHRRIPHPVDVLIDEARRGRLARIEPLVCGRD